MKVTAISDLHGNLIDIEPCDLLLICGDISPLEIQRDYIQMTKWIFNEFQEWIMKIDCPTVILTPGNHDFWFEKMINQSNTYLFNKLTILIDGEEKVYNSTDDKWYKIYGTPWCKQCGPWAFMANHAKLAKKYEKIKMSLILTIVSLGTRVLLAYLLAPSFGVEMIWWAIVIGWILADTIGIVYGIKIEKWFK